VGAGFRMLIWLEMDESFDGIVGNDKLLVRQMEQVGLENMLTVLNRLRIHVHLVRALSLSQVKVMANRCMVLLA
jgi:hypothetical protein